MVKWEKGYGLVSYSKTRRILKEYVSGDVSADAIEYLRLYIEEIVSDICKEIVLEHQVMNERRRECGLPQHRRIHLSELLNLVVQVNKSPSVKMIGEKANSGLSCQVE
jgi:hypothetical protein